MLACSHTNTSTLIKRIVNTNSKDLSYLDSSSNYSNSNKDISYLYEIYLMMFSMVAEIGGYSGLLIGFSLMDIALLFQYFVDKLSEMKHV